MTVSVLGAEVLSRKNASANVVAVQSADNVDHTRALDQVRALMLDALQGVMEGPANNASQYQISTKGSLLRARLALASCRSFECSQEYAIVAAACCELIHNASLVHDDLLDGDQLRRGQATVWKRHGRGVALCAGDLLLCTAFAVSADLADVQQSRLLTQYLAAMTGRVIVGQSIEIAPVELGVQPRFRAYIEAAQAKTVPLIQLPLMTGAIAAKSGLSVLDSIRRFAEAVGLAYQIIDDLDDLVESKADLKSKVKSLHPFHAWHHHRGRLSDSPERRVQRATRHALAALQRGRRQLKCLEEKMSTPITPTLGPLLMKLECRAQAHRYSFGSNGEGCHDTTTTWG
jgi:geranylgeranyl diphosphate synthase type II